MSLILSAASLVERIVDNQLPRLTGNLCFWGHWFGKPNDHLCTIISSEFYESASQLQFVLSRNELLSVFEPDGISIENDQLIIQQAHKIRIEWPDINKDGYVKNRFFYEFNRSGKKITGNSNIHWSSIDHANLSVNRPGVLMTNLLP